MGSGERLFSSCKNTISDKRTKLEKFPVKFATNNTENSNASNDESIKKFKPNDVVINHQNHNEDLACLTNDDEELSF
ncbi:unnamed protein product [Rotaria magnacalcarata]|uniref:Uncharacterized protein n=1 Tax=Rotaria magnacalcarata TaxID=392030 RepID=A0A8S2K2B7_9BILA|nr:unnamed protein product [Rotaria magnacalcarata]CAF3853633.1 unnamed protein product [Rotaria magnacalcarata]